jgi:hypothetical protein
MDSLEEKICRLAKKHLPGKVELVFEKSLENDYLLAVEKRGNRSVLHVNLCWEEALVRMVDESYIEAVMEHEAGHLKTKVPKCEGLTIVAPMGVMAKYGVRAHTAVSEMLTGTFSDMVNDVFSMQAMSREAAEKYLHWLAYINTVYFNRTINSSWFGRIRAVHLFHLAFQLAIPEELNIQPPEPAVKMCQANFRELSDKVIIDILKDIFAKAYRAASKKENTLNLLAECTLLNEAIMKQEPFELGKI